VAHACNGQHVELERLSRVSPPARLSRFGDRRDVGCPLRDQLMLSVILIVAATAFLLWTMRRDGGKHD
jgi:hypothetical protein